MVMFNTDTEIADRFNLAFRHFAIHGETRVSSMQQDIGGIAAMSEETDEIHGLLVQVAQLAGSSQPAYASISRAFSEMAETAINCAGASGGAHRQLYQQDACLLFVFAQTSAPRRSDGSMAAEYGVPLIETACRLLATEPDEAVQDMIFRACDFLQARMDRPRSGRLSTPLAGNAALDRMAASARQALGSYAH